MEEKARLNWVIQMGKWENGKNAFLGKYKVGAVFWDVMGLAGADKPYATSCSLPGIKPRLGNFETEEEAIGKIEAVVTLWIHNAGLES